MNRFAQLLYGKVIYIFETNLKQEQLPTVFSPATYWVDVTGINCEVGYVVEFRTGAGIVLVKPEPSSGGETIQDTAPVNPDVLALSEAILELSDRIDELKGENQ